MSDIITELLSSISEDLNIQKKKRETETTKITVQSRQLRAKCGDYITMSKEHDIVITRRDIQEAVLINIDRYRYLVREAEAAKQFGLCN